jgi:polygalacturonase
VSTDPTELDPPHIGQDPWGTDLNNYLLELEGLIDEAAGIVIQATPPDDTTILWADTTVEGAGTMPGPPGILIGSTPPADDDQLWADTTITGASTVVLTQPLPYKDVRDFGAKGDGTTTDNKAIQDAINAVGVAGGTVYFPPGRYRITTEIQVRASNVNIEMDPAAILDASAVSPNTHPAFRFLGSFVTLSNVHLAANAPADSETITMTSVAGINVGDLLGLWSTDVWTDERAGYCHSEYIEVTGISGNVLTLGRPLRDSYTAATSKDFTKYTQLKNCTWKGGKIYFDPASFDYSGTRSGLALFCVDNFRISDLTVETAEWGGIDLRHVRFGTVDNCYVYNCGNLQGDTGYGISISGEMVSVNGGQSKRCRHGLDVNGGFSVPISRDISVNGFISIESYTGSMGTHAGCESVIFNDCQSMGGNDGLSLRGRKISVLGGYFECSEIGSHAPNYGRGLNVGDDFITWNGGNGPGGTDLTVIGATFRRIGKPGSTSADDGIYCSAPLVRAYFADNHFMGFTGHGALFQGNYNTSATFVDNVWDGSSQLAGKNGIYISPHSVTGGLGTTTDIVVDGDKFYNINNSAFRMRGTVAPGTPSSRITIHSPYASAAEFVHLGISSNEHISDVRISGRMAGAITTSAQVLVTQATNDGRINVEDISYAGDGGVSHGGAKLGFFGTAPALRPTGVSPKTALEALGLGTSLLESAQGPPGTTNGSINVKDYGAKGDGTTDDTAAIQAADNAIATGGVLYFPAGRYVVAATINKSPYTVWQGVGNNPYTTSITGTNIRYTGEGVCIRIAPATQINNCRGHIEGIRLTYNGTLGTATTSVGISIDKVIDQIIADCYILSFDVGVDLLASSAATYIERCYIGSGRIGVRSTGCSDNWMIHTQTAGRDYGLYSDSTASWQLVNARAQGSGIANIYLNRNGYFSMVGGFSDSASLQSSGTRYGIYMKDCQNANITGVTMYSNNIDQIVIENTGTDFTGTFGICISGCSINGNGVRIIPTSGIAKAITISGNTSPSALNYLLSVDQPAGGATIEDVVVTGNSRFGAGVLGIQNITRLVMVGNAGLPDLNQGTALTAGGLSTGPTWVSFSGVTNDYVGISAATSPAITGDLCVVARVAAADWTPAATQTIVSQYMPTGNLRNWSFSLSTVGALTLTYSVDGTATASKTSTASVVVNDGDWLWVAFTHDVDNGASGNDVRFWTSPDGTTWTQLGTTITTAGAVTRAATGVAVTLSGITNGTQQRFAGRASNLSVRSGIGAAGVVGGTEVCVYDPSIPTPSYKDIYGKVWTLNGSASFGGPLGIKGSLAHTGYTAGFYGTTPIAKPTAVSAAVAMQNLGLGSTLATAWLMWTGTQVQYDAIVTKDPNTLYAITG